MPCGEDVTLFRSSMRAQEEGALRQVLAIAGKECGFTASVLAYGVYTPDEVEGFIRQFEAGNLTLSAVTDITSRGLPTR